MGHLGETMHAGIRTSGPLNAFASLIDGLNGLLDGALNGGKAVLTLPAMKGRAMVFDFESISGHRGC